MREAKLTQQHVVNLAEVPQYEIPPLVDVRLQPALHRIVRVFAGAAMLGSLWAQPRVGDANLLEEPVVFVSRRILPSGSIYWDVPDDMPGVGPHSRFRVAAPGKLCVLQPEGELSVLVDGSAPGSNRYEIMDVSAPDVSYDGTKIVFAGFSRRDLEPTVDVLPARAPDGWRLYVIDVDGSGLRRLTSDSPRLDLSQFGAASEALAGVDDADPVWLPDGRIVFSSTRWPSLAQYSGVRATNLFVINADGTGMHRITAERNGADRPLVDPVTGKIVFARWWRNHRFAAVNPEEVVEAGDGYAVKDGLTIDRARHVGGADRLFRNQWHAAVIRPDGTELGMWSPIEHAHDASHYYGGSFDAAGDLIANYFPMANMTEASGFGGLRRYRRGATNYEHLAGVTRVTTDLSEYANRNPLSFGIYLGSYAAEPAVLSDGRILFSQAADVGQDYGLYVADANGRDARLIYDAPDTSELQAKAIRSRRFAPILPDTVPLFASPLPPASDGRLDVDGSFVFDALNVYFNGAVDTLEMNAPPVGSADRIRFYADFQRTSNGSFPHLDWPILLKELRVSGDGSVRDANAPANLPLFEQIRSADGTVPLTTGGLGGAAHVAGMNYGRPGQVARCVGCHAGHTTISVPDSDEDAQWTNLAPGANVRVSSTRDATRNRGLVDRKVLKGAVSDYWSSQLGETEGQWVELIFAEPILVRSVRLYDPRRGGDLDSSVTTRRATVRLFEDEASEVALASAAVSGVSAQGTDVAFGDQIAQVVRVELDQVEGAFGVVPVASLAEVEVIGSGLNRPRTAPTRSRSLKR